MYEVKLLRPTDAHDLDNVAEDVFDDPLIESSTEAFLADLRHRLVVALDNNVVVGFASAVIYLHPDKRAPELWINEIGVAPTHQRQGIGRALLQAMLEEAKQSGCTVAWVLTERENAAAWRCTNQQADSSLCRTQRCLRSRCSPYRKSIRHVLQNQKQRNISYDVRCFFITTYYSLIPNL